MQSYGCLKNEDFKHDLNDYKVVANNLANACYMLNSTKWEELTTI